MMRSQRKALPLVVLLGIEVIAIIGLQALGSSSAMTIPWGDLNTWLSTGTIDQVAPPVVRLVALIFSYWMFVSTALCIVAQVSRIQSVVRATNLFALPSVRRVVDGAMVVSIATTSVVGLTGTAAFADEVSSVPASSDVTQSIAASAIDNSSVPTPTVGGSGAAADGPATTSTTVDDSSVTTSSIVPDSTTTSSTSTSIADSTTTTAANSSGAVSSLAPTPGDDSVPTPKPGAPLASTTSTTINTTTTVPQGPSTPADSTTTTTPGSPSTPATPSTPNNGGTQVLAETDHRVVAGENLWTIARDALASSSGRSASSISESEIRDYWLKVIDANRDHLRSKDPHWIFPGEVISLPSQDAANTGS